MSDVLADLKALIAEMTEEEKAELDEILAEELSQPWLPTPGPQTDAYFCEADLLLYGGAAGGGKTDLILGLSLTAHQRVVVFRRAYPDLKGITERLEELVGSAGLRQQPPRYKRGGRLIEFGALEGPGAEKSWQGNPHDLICFDEGAQLSADKVSFVMGWLRSADPGQRCRAIIASNPPIGSDGAWMLEWFAPWLDPLFANPAKSGELRWCITIGSEIRWVDGPGVTEISNNGEVEVYTHESRTFIPAMLDDNPYLRDTDYRARIQNMPEPLRSILLKGDFMAGRQDDEWQIIPSEWVRLANERWRRAPEKRRTMIALSGDIAIGGKDNTSLASLYTDNWFGPIIRKKGIECTDPADVAVMMLAARKNGADLSVDGTGGWGSGVKSSLKNNHEIDCYSIVYSKKSLKRTKDGKLGFLNLRAQMYWTFREALDPEDGDEIMLPPDTRLTAQLTAARYHVKGTNIVVEEKEDIRSRLGVSPDDADSTVQAWLRRSASLLRDKKAPVIKSTQTIPTVAGGWLGR